MYSILGFFFNVEAKPNGPKRDDDEVKLKFFEKKSYTLFYSKFKSKKKTYTQFYVFFSTLKPFFDEVSTSELAGKIFTRQNSDENAQSARELASEKSCVRLSCVRHRSDNPNRARECDRLESLQVSNF